MRNIFTKRRPLIFSLVAYLLAMGSSSAQYCASAATSTWDSDIVEVRLGSIVNNTTNTPCATYTYFNNLSTNLDIGASYSMSVTLGVHASCGSDIYTKAARVWIDFNRNGQFEAAELLGATSYTGGTVTSTINFTVPCIAQPGVTRMRVVCVENTPAAIQPCGTFTYGETEDYNVELFAGGNPSANFSIPDTVYTGARTTFLNANPTGYTHKWFNSALDPTLQNVASTNINYSYTFNTAGTYNLKLESSNCQGSAFVTKQVVVRDPTSTPVPNFVTSANRVTFTGDPVLIQFYDLSLFGASQWEWTVTPDINGGAPWFWATGDQFSQSPTAFFYDEGIYEVCLTVTNMKGTSAPLCRTSYIIIGPPSGQSFSNQMGRDLNCLLDSGVIYDSGGPLGDYSNSEQNIFVIEPCGATEVKLTFNSFNTEASLDQLKVYDGPNTSSPEIGTYSGTTIPPSLVAKSGKMTLEFLSNNSTVASGFEARWSSTIPNNGLPTADFILPDTIWSCASGLEYLFRNSSTGVIPGQASYDWILDYDANVSYPAGYCEACEETNTTWKYPSTNSPLPISVRMVLKSCEGNDTVVKNTILAPRSSNPIVDFNADIRRIAAGGTVRFTEMVEGACELQWNFTPSAGVEYINGTNSTSRDPQVKFNQPGSYSVQLVARNDNGQANRIRTNYVDVISYCQPIVNLSSVADIGITNVSIENIDRASSAGVGVGYTNYSATDVVNLIAGKNYSITVQRATNFNQVNRKVWIDFNRDGEFTEPQELVMFQTASSSLSHTASFTVPDFSFIVPGATRMRVAVAKDNNPNTPCGPLAVGEYEDYGVMLMLDDQPPVITMLGADTLILEVNNNLVDPGATAFDNIEGNITSRIVVSNSVDVTQPGIYYIDYNVVDGSGLAAVTVRRTVIVAADLTSPVLTLLGTDPFLHSVLVPFNDPGFTAIDNPGNRNISNVVVVDGQVDITMIGDYQLRYKVTDAFGNSTQTTRTVQVRDTTAPQVNVGNRLFWQAGIPFINPVQVTDNFDASPKLIQNGSVNVNAFGDYVITFSAMDASGNTSALQMVTVTVGDTVKPVISTVPGTETIIVEVNDVNFIEPAVTATDNFFPNVQITRNASAVNVFVLGTYPIIYTATDGAGNTATWTRNIRVVDTEAPVITGSTINLCRWTTDFSPEENITIRDNYNDPQWFIDNNKIIVVQNSVDLNFPGIYTIIYRAIDESGNTSKDFVLYVNVKECLTSAEQNMAQLKVYPNPTNGLVNIELNQLINDEANIEITNVLGQTKKSTTKVENGRAVIYLTELPAGIYTIDLIYQGTKASAKIVLTR